MQDEDETHTPSAQQLSESQEIVVGNSGRAILLGDELADLESVHGHGRSAPYLRSTQKRGACPAWLRSSSPKMKAVLGIIAIVLVAFVAVLITGATQLSDDGSGGSSLQSDKNVVVSGPGDNTSPAPTPSPTTSKSSSSSSSTPNDSVSSVNILLSDSLESMVPKFADGLNANEQEDWKAVEESIESTIITAFSERLPEGYTLESVQIEKFDGYDTTSLRRKQKRRTGTSSTRHLQTNSESGSSATTTSTTTTTTNTVHAVLYASSITVDCAASDCSTAADIVADITSEISQLEFLEVEDEEDAGAVETDAPVGSSSSSSSSSSSGGGGSPTQSPVTTISSLSPTTLAPSILVTIEPTSGSPSQAVTNATEGPLPLFIREEVCSVESLCGRCEGECSGDDTCGEGLFCFLRMGYEYITGCLGPGEPGRSYCYDPLSEGYTDILVSDVMCDRKSPCEKCRGGCDADEDCGANLYCFGRGGYEAVPGCAGQGTFGMDYCFDPNDIQGFRV